MKNLLLTLSLMVLLPMHLLAMRTDSTRIFQGFSGGMLLHAGYQFGSSPVIDSWHGATYGIGGALRVNLGKHLRLGGEGFVSKSPSMLSNQAARLTNGSYVRNGWGGVSADACWRLKRVWPYVGGTIGGGSCKALYIHEGDLTDWQPEESVIYNTRSYFLLDPYVGIDWCLTSRVHLACRADWLLAFNRHLPSSSPLLKPTGPRVYFGFMFCH